MSLDPRPLAAAVLAGDVRQVRGLLRDATESDRQACAESLKSFLAGPEIHRRPTRRDYKGLPQEERVLLDRRYSRLSAAAVAVKSGLADGLPAALLAAGGTGSWISPWEDDFDEIANVYADRRPPWLAELVDQRLQNDFVGDPVFVGGQGGLEAWPMARRLVRLGAIARPAIAQYTTRMPISLYHEGWVSPGQPPGIVWQPDARPGLLYHPLDGLLADPGLLDDEVWRLFEVPGSARELARCKGTWEEALVTLSERGLLDRGRLLDAGLGAFFRDFAPTQLGWYAALHDRLAPTLDEVVARAGRYLALLGTNSAHGVALAQRACDRLLAAGRLPAADFLAASAPPLLFPQKGVALRQLKLLGKIAREASLRPLALATASGAFGHSRLDVQEAALDLIGQLGVPEGAERAVIAGHAAYLAPVLTGKAADLGLLAVPPAPAPAPAGITLTPAPAAGPLPLPPEDPAALIRLLTQLMEDAPDPLAVERALADAVRLATLPKPDRERLGSPLVKRAKQLVSGPTRHPHALSEAIARLALAFACVPCPPPVWASNKTVLFARIPAVRALEACHLIEDGPAGAELLAEPSAADGSVHPDTLLSRLATWQDAPVFRYDLEVALLRVPPVDTAFWVAWDEVHPASAEQARLAYQARTADLTVEPVIETAPGQTGRSRATVLARVTSDPPAAAGGSRCWQLLTDPPDPVLHDHFNSRVSPVVASWPLLCPWQPELAAAHLLRPLSECLAPGPGPAGPGATAVMGLTRSGAPFGPIRHLALLTGLGSAEASVRIAAADVWTQAALAGRLDPNLAAGALVKGVTGDAIKLTRLADGLRYASSEPVSALMIARTVFASADELVPARPPNLYLLLELAREIGAATALPEPPESIVALAAEKGSTKLAAAARQVLNLLRDPVAEPRDVGGQAGLGGLADDGGARGAHHVEERLRVDRARVEVGVPVRARVERVPRVVAVHQVDPAGDRLHLVNRVGQVDAGGVRVAGIQAEPDRAVPRATGALRHRAHPFPEPGDRLERARHRAVAARRVLDEQRQRPVNLLDRLDPVRDAHGRVRVPGDVPAVDDEPLRADRGGGLQLLVE
jgi:hypothetical protein